MKLETTFTEKSDGNDFITAKVSMDRHKDMFRYALSTACVEKGILCGVNETEDGFELGFTSQEDYETAMQEAEKKLLARLDENGDSHADRRAKRALDRALNEIRSNPRSQPKNKDIIRGDSFERERGFDYGR